MSLNNTSQPSVKYCADKVNAKYIHGRPEPELVPSRYALKVGEIDVMVVSDGVLPCQVRCWATTLTRPSVAREIDDTIGARGGVEHLNDRVAPIAHNTLSSVIEAGEMLL